MPDAPSLSFYLLAKPVISVVYFVCEVELMQKEHILDILKRHRSEFRERFGVERLGLFGSYARNEAKSGSDIDILVEFDEPSFDRYMDLKAELAALFGIEVDLVLADSLKPRLKPHILQEVINVEG